MLRTGKSGNGVLSLIRILRSLLVMWVAQQHDVKRTLRKPCGVTLEHLKEG